MTNLFTPLCGSNCGCLVKSTKPGLDTTPLPLIISACRLVLPAEWKVFNRFAEGGWESVSRRSMLLGFVDCAEFDVNLDWPGSLEEVAIAILWSEDCGVCISYDEHRGGRCAVKNVSSEHNSKSRTESYQIVGKVRLDLALSGNRDVELYWDAQNVVSSFLNAEHRREKSGAKVDKASCAYFINSREI